ncbi:hypothetical protein DH2020_042772 [Rehmannia glutinosa]|uniref:Uncharacterized protein n=1 Tax=Rehmannia glutinosa TaxID=99300 RepID=A0ABR0UMG2_REHGL
MMQESSVISLSPSFNSYSNTKLAEIAARVVEEFGSEEFYDEFYFEREENSSAGRIEEEDEDAGEDEEFEFAFVTTRDSDLSSPISADEIFQNGQIRPVYPVFNRDLFLGRRVGFENENEKENVVPNSGSDKGPAVRLPLRKLFIEERETTMTVTSSSFSSEADDELDGVPAETYCVWRPKEDAAADGRCKKSSSTGSISKRWKFRDLLHRSHSDGGKDRFVFLGPSNSGRRKENDEKVKTPAGAGKVKTLSPTPPSYNRDGGEKRRSYLPYRQDLVGLFANVNGLSKNLQPF